MRERRKKKRRKKESWWQKFRHFMNRKWVQAATFAVFLCFWSWRTADNFNESEIKLIVATSLSTLFSLYVGKR